MVALRATRNTDGCMATTTMNTTTMTATAMRIFMSIGIFLLYKGNVQDMFIAKFRATKRCVNPISRSNIFC
jgi:hypothetical protein